MSPKPHRDQVLDVGDGRVAQGGRPVLVAAELEGVVPARAFQPACQPIGECPNSVCIAKIEQVGR